MTKKTTWQSKRFSELSLNQLYDVLKLRVDIFVVEQTCYYPDLDGEKNLLDRHPQTIHLLGYQAEQLVAYLRILPKGQSYTNNISIGRVVIAKQARGGGLGHELMTEALSLCQTVFTNEDIKISAQQHLKPYYESHGFTQVSEMYLEDGIPHIGMTKEAD
ncbi:GNAT family N-acetyltransferase [Colwellia psychrerythraea]|uniref:Protein ElaA n=1 Tax=Colwellia psychrerythraea TaxID=28229 RepID=A0A099L2T9_COLPS|nr:GNAT family N-acetyltransferase [Colwellia psychrerythraea]KGJ96462.1 GCN5-related N-acetyltransferase [Colwellia psychrerythraea]